MFTKPHLPLRHSYPVCLAIMQQRGSSRKQVSSIFCDIIVITFHNYCWGALEKALLSKLTILFLVVYISLYMDLSAKRPKIFKKKSSGPTPNQSQWLCSQCFHSAQRPRNGAKFITHCSKTEQQIWLFNLLSIHRYIILGQIHVDNYMSRPLANMQIHLCYFFLVLVGAYKKVWHLYRAQFVQAMFT